MTLLPIINPDNPVLRQKAKTVKDPTDHALQQLMDDMLETMRAAPGVGLAAPQVAVGRRIAVIEYAEALPEDAPSGTPEPKPKRYVIVNPEIIMRSDDMVDGVEGCLSLPGYLGNVLRHEAVVVKALNRKGKPVKIKAHGWLARIFQHEIDHLNGVLFTDLATRIWKIEPPVEGEEPPGLHDRAE